MVFCDENIRIGLEREALGAANKLMENMTPGVWVSVDWFVAQLTESSGYDTALRVLDECCSNGSLVLSKDQRSITTPQC